MTHNMDETVYVIHTERRAEEALSSPTCMEPPTQQQPILVGDLGYDSASRWRELLVMEAPNVNRDVELEPDYACETMPSIM